MQVRIDPQLAAAWRTHPSARQHLLIGVQRADDATEESLQSLGFTVRRRLRLASCFAVSGPGSAALKLLEVSWVLSIERDGPVHTMKAATDSPIASP